MRFLRKTIAGVLLAAVPAVASAQVPVIDAATLSQAQITAGNTGQIMTSNQQILTTVQQTLAAVSGNRQTGDLAQMALGGGFSLGGAPDLSSLMSGGQMSWGNLGSFGTTATNILNALNLVKTLSGTTGTKLTGTDKAYQGAVNIAGALTGMVQGTQSGAAQRSQAFNTAATLIGSAPDIKGSIDQNSQIGIQTGLTMNEMIGVLNAANAALNAQQQQELAAMAKAVRFMQYKPGTAKFVRQ